MRGIIIAISLLVAACGGDMAADNATTVDFGSNTMDANATDTGLDDNMSMDANVADTNAMAMDANVQDDPEETIFCERFRERMSRRECSRLIEQYDNVSSGVGALAADSRMYVGRDYDVTLAIGRPEDEAAVVELATAGATDPANTQTVDTAEIKIGRYMRATLIGPQFRIDPEEAVERDLGSGSRETWTWKITPLTPGTHALRARVEALSGPSGVRLGDPIDRPLAITVTVTDAEKAKQAHEERMTSMERAEAFLRSATGIAAALAALIAALGLVIWRARTLGKRPEEPPESGGGTGGENGEGS